MKIKDIIEQLQKYEQDKELYIFAEGKLYPSLDVSYFEKIVSIDCGWVDIKEEIS